VSGLRWLTQESPDPTRGGGAMRQAGLLRQLARHVPIDLLVAGHPPDPEVAAAMRTVIVLPGEEAPSRRQRVRGARALVDPRFVPEVDAARRTRRALLAAIARLPHTPDVTVVTHLPLAPLLPQLRGRTVFHPFHAVADQLRGEARGASGLRAARLRRYAANAARWEQKAVDGADLTVVVSDADAALLARRGRRVVVAPNAVDAIPADRLRPRPAEPIVLLPGSLDYAPNVDGACWMATEVWPLVRRAVPGARLQVVGRSPRPAVRALAGVDGVEVHGDVPDIAPWFDDARVVVVPLRFGTGTRLKALEAMAAGRPLVGTSVGLAGLDLEDGVHALLADDAATLAERIARALGPAGDALIEPARERIEARHTWPVVAEALLAELHAVPEHR